VVLRRVSVEVSVPAGARFAAGPGAAVAGAVRRVAAAALGAGPAAAGVGVAPERWISDMAYSCSYLGGSMLLPRRGVVKMRRDAASRGGSGQEYSVSSSPSASHISSNI